MIVILTILKVTGIILAAALAFVMLAVLLFLFVPLCYSARVFRAEDAPSETDRQKKMLQEESHASEKKMQWGGRFSIRWLLGLVRLEGQLQPEGYMLKFNVLWLTVKSFSTLHREDAGGRREKNAQKSAPEKQMSAVKDGDIPDVSHVVQEAVMPDDRDAAYRTEKTADKRAEDPAYAPDSRQRKSKHTEEAAPHRTNRAGKKAGAYLQHISDLVLRLPELLMERLWHVCETLESGSEYIAESLEKLQTRLKGVKKRMDPFMDSRARDWYGRTFLHLNKALHHFRIRKVSGKAQIGTGSPDTSALLYGLIMRGLPAGSRAQIEADLYETCIEGDVRFSGHMRMNHLAWAALRILADKDTRLMYRRFRTR